MIQTIIVDDEYLIRYAIRNAVDWNSLGYVIIAEAENGEDALSKIKYFQPDLVLLDINLPIMDGIEVCRQIQKQHLNTNVIILTGYDDFKSIQQCLRLGVLNYVVKPIEQNELITALQKAKQSINIKKNMFERLLGTQDPAISDVNAPVDTLQTIYNETNRILDSHPQSLFVGIAEIDYLKRKYPSVNEQSTAIDYVVKSVTEFSHQKNFNLLCSRYDNQILLCFLEPLDKTELYISFLQEYIFSHLGLSLSVGLCIKPPDVGEMNDCIEIARDALTQKFYIGTMAFSKEMKKTHHNSSFQISQSHLQNLLLKAQNKEFMTYIEDILTKAINMKINKDRFILLCAVIINTVWDFSLSINIQINTDFKNQFCIATYSNYCETAEEIKHELLNTCSYFIQQYIQKHQMKPIVREVIHYIKNHYSDCSLSSGSIAKEISVSPNYLSKMFRQEFGMTITEYITEIRISEAVSIIEESENISITELAYSVGYNDSFYFSKIFRKQKGISPSDYIKVSKQTKK